jgi:predicted amidophosphoribosyltransferase
VDENRSSTFCVGDLPEPVLPSNPVAGNRKAVDLGRSNLEVAIRIADLEDLGSHRISPIDGPGTCPAIRIGKHGELVTDSARTCDDATPTVGGVRVLDLVLPERCAVCDVPGHALCASCRASLTRLVPPVCERCGSPGPWPVRRCAECAGRRLAFVDARSAIVYDGRARALVRAWKERGRRRLAQEAAMLVAEMIPAPAVQCLVPVPGDPERALRRGDVPARTLAVELSLVWSVPVHDVLARTRTLPRQRGLSLDARRRNVRGSVEACSTVPREVCVVDDVYTSGATVDACARACRRAGTRRVHVVTLARAVR